MVWTFLLIIFLQHHVVMSKEIRWYSWNFASHWPFTLVLSLAKCEGWARWHSRVVWGRNWDAGHRKPVRGNSSHFQPPELVLPCQLWRILRKYWKWHGRRYLLVCLFLFHVCECFTCIVSVCTMSIPGTHGGPMRMTDSQLLAIGWMLGTELGSSPRAASALGFRAISDCMWCVPSFHSYD